MEIRIEPQAQELLKLLNSAGFAAYVVGGCVRDSILKRPVHDWDITTGALPEQLLALFSQEHCVTDGLKHGTVTVIRGGIPYEITSFRADGQYTDHRRPESVRLNVSLEEDLARRDFTVNAMAYSPETGLCDPYGGLFDLKHGILRAVGEAKRRFEEDALRILRALRFSSELGFVIERETAAAMRAKRALLSYVSAERISAELCRMLCGQDVRRVLLAFHDIITEVLPELGGCQGFAQRNPYHCYDVYTHSVYAVSYAPAEAELRWAALLHDCGKPFCLSTDAWGCDHFYGHPVKSEELARACLQRLRCSRAFTEQVCRLVKLHDTSVDASKRGVRRALSAFGQPLFFELMQLKRADILAQSLHGRKQNLQWLNELERLVREEEAAQSCLSLKELPVNGHDMLALGYRGARIGAVLRRLLNEVLEERCPCERTALLQKAEVWSAEETESRGEEGV